MERQALPARAFIRSSVRGKVGQAIVAHFAPGKKLIESKRDRVFLNRPWLIFPEISIVLSLPLFYWPKKGEGRRQGRCNFIFPFITHDWIPQIEKIMPKLLRAIMFLCVF